MLECKFEENAEMKVQMEVRKAEIKAGKMWLIDVLFSFAICASIAISILISFAIGIRFFFSSRQFKVTSALCSKIKVAD